MASLRTVGERATVRVEDDITQPATIRTDKGRVEREKNFWQTSEDAKLEMLNWSSHQGWQRLDLVCRRAYRRYSRN